jgi:hypothetical protein
MTEKDAGKSDPSTLLKVVEAAAMSPKDVKRQVGNWRRRAGKRADGETEAQFEARVAEKVAAMAVSRYAKLCSFSGGLSGLTAVVPGVGTIISMTAGGLADTAVCMKLQVDMCMCITEAFGWDLSNEDARHLAFLIAAGGTLEHAGTPVAARVASKAGVKMLQMYLKGAALQTLKELFKKIGIVLTRKALEKALPFGIGTVVGAAANYALAKYVGGQAIEWFKLEKEGQ